MKHNTTIDISKFDYFNDQVFLDEYIDIFEGSAEKLIDQLRGSLRNKNHDFRDTVHAIKGLSGNIGAATLREITIKAEGLSEDDYNNKSDDFFNEISKELSKVRAELLKCASKNKKADS